MTVDQFTELLLSKINREVVLIILDFDGCKSSEFENVDQNMHEISSDQNLLEFSRDQNLSEFPIDQNLHEISCQTAWLKSWGKVSWIPDS